MPECLILDERMCGSALAQQSLKLSNWPQASTDLPFSTSEVHRRARRRHFERTHYPLHEPASRSRSVWSASPPNALRQRGWPAVLACTTLVQDSACLSERFFYSYFADRNQIEEDESLKTLINAKLNEEPMIPLQATSLPLASVALEFTVFFRFKAFDISGRPWTLFIAA